MEPWIDKRLFLAKRNSFLHNFQIPEAEACEAYRGEGYKEWKGSRQIKSNPRKKGLSKITGSTNPQENFTLRMESYVSLP